MTIQIEHTLSKEEAKDRIEGLIERYQGNLDIRDGAVNLDFYVPFMLQVLVKRSSLPSTIVFNRASRKGAYLETIRRFTNASGVY